MLIEHNCRVKFYPDENGVYQPYEAFFSSKHCFRDPGWELVTRADDEPAYKGEGNAKKGSDERSRAVSFARARNKCFDLLMCNVFPKKDECNLFVTLTFDAERIDRYSYNEVVKRLGRWLDNRVRRNGLKYMLVPEFHKDGAVHCHGVMNESALALEWSGVKQKGKRVYNICDFELGFTNVKRISGANCTDAVSKYIFKYLTKSNGVKVGGRYYLRGGALKEPLFKRLTVDYDRFKWQASRVFDTEYLGECYTIRMGKVLHTISTDYPQ